MTDPILQFLAVDGVALLLLGMFAPILPVAAFGFLVTALSVLGMLLCLPTLLAGVPAMALVLQVGPPGLSLHLALDPLSACLLFIALLSGTAIAIFQSTSVPLAQAASVRITACCLAGTVLTLLAADGVSMAIGVAVMGGAIWLPRVVQRKHPVVLIPLLLLTAICLLTPSGFDPGFDAIRAAPADPNQANPAIALTIAAVAGLGWSRLDDRCWTRDALTAGVVIPTGSYLLLRLIVDLCQAAAQTGWGFVLLLAGGAVAVVQSWRAASQPDIDDQVACLMWRQAALAGVGVGLALIARATDLPGAASFALAATFLSAIGGIAGVLTSITIHAIGASAGTYRLSRLGGLVHTMPTTSAALAAGLLGLSALPPGLGFAGLWLLFQAILLAPRTGGLLFQLPLALAGAALALSSALVTAGSVRLIGIALLGRPRTPGGAGAQEGKSLSRMILLVLASLSIAAGALPGLVLQLLAEPAIHALAGTSADTRVGLALLDRSTSTPSYLALPVLALLALATGAVLLVPRRINKEAKIAGLWADGIEPPVGLPFGEPAAQSDGEGFLPALPKLPQLPRLPAFAPPRPPAPVTALWLVLAAFAALLTALAVIG